MKVVSILLAWVNMLFAGLVMLLCVSTSNPGWDSVGWLAIRVGGGGLVVLISAFTFRDSMQPIHPGKMLIAGLFLVLMGSGAAMWGIHLSILSGDLKVVMILFGGSLVLQGIASILGLQDSGTMPV